MPATAPFKPVPVRPRHDGWTPEKQEAFIEALEGCGCVSRAARSVGMSAESAYRLRHRADASDFAQAWELAVHLGFHKLTDIAFERAIEGVVMPVFHKGEVVGERRLFNDRLLMFLLRHHRPDLYSPDVNRPNWTPSPYLEAMVRDIMKAQKEAEEDAAKARKEAEEALAEAKKLLARTIRQSRRIQREAGKKPDTTPDDPDDGDDDDHGGGGSGSGGGGSGGSGGSGSGHGSTTGESCGGSSAASGGTGSSPVDVGAKSTEAPQTASSDLQGGEVPRNTRLGLTFLTLGTASYRNAGISRPAWTPKSQPIALARSSRRSPASKRCRVPVTSIEKGRRDYARRPLAWSVRPVSRPGAERLRRSYPERAEPTYGLTHETSDHLLSNG